MTVHAGFLRSMDIFRECICAYDQTAEEDPL